MTADSKMLAAGDWTLAADEERFQVRSRLEILAILRGLVGQAEFATLYFDRGRDFIVSMLLAVNPEFEEVVLDLGAEPAANERLLRAGRLVVASQLAHIRVQFHADRAELTMFDGAPAFRVRLPAAVARLQRRDFYRVHIPMHLPIRCDVPNEADDEAAWISLYAVDLSAGGIGLLNVPPAMVCDPGTIWRGCRLVLPETGSLSLDFRITRVEATSNPRGQVSRRAGAEFVDISHGQRAQLQRLIHRYEREQIVSES